MLAQVSDWRPVLYDLGEIEVKHGARLHVFNVFTPEYGNPETPSKMKLMSTPTQASSVPVNARTHLRATLGADLTGPSAPGESFQRSTHRAAHHQIMPQRLRGTLPDI
jgi:hypothetical protein